MKGTFVFVFVVILVLGGWAPSNPQETNKVIFPYAPIGLNSLPWFIAKEAKLFQRHGVQVDAVYAGLSPLIISMMLSGTANVAGIGGPAPITATLQGGDINYVAAIIPYFTNALIARKEIQSIEELNGKRVGMGRIGTVPHFGLQVIIDHYKLKDVRVVQGIGPTEQVVALSRGSVDAAVVAAPYNFTLVKAGFRQFVSPKDFQKFGGQFINQGIAVRKAALAKDRDAVAGIIKATAEGIRVMHANEVFTKKVIADYLRVTDIILLDEIYRSSLESFVKKPFVPPAAIGTMVQQLVKWGMVEPKVANRPATAFYDNSIVQEIEQSGFFDQLWK